MASRNRRGKRHTGVLSELAKDYTFPIIQKVERFPKAKFCCRLCEFYFDDVPACKRHFEDQRHIRKLEIKRQNEKLRNLRPPSRTHICHLSKSLTEVFEENGLSDGDMLARKEIAEAVQAFLAKDVPDIELRVYGSSLTGFGLKTSDLNMNLVVPDGRNPAQLLTQIYNLIAESDTYRNVKSKFTDIVPKVAFSSPCETVHCKISLSSDPAYYTSRLLATYSKIDPRVRQLAVLFRHWAKVSEVDDQTRGTLPAYAFDLMTVFYLQHCKPPILPVLWVDELAGNSWDKLLTYVERWKQEWVCRNNDEMGQLWLDLLSFYGIRFDISKYVVSIRQAELLGKVEMKWQRKGIAIEDPFYRRNIGRVLFSTEIIDFVYDSLRASYVYFSLPSNQDELYANSDEDFESDSESNYTSDSDFEPEGAEAIRDNKQHTRKQIETPEYKHVFTKDTLTDYECPPIICSICDREGHLNNQCPDSQLYKIMPLQPTSSSQLKLLTRAVRKAQAKYELTEEERADRENVRDCIEKIVQRIFPDAQCRLFGSSVNGFGFHDSDLDVCLTFKGRKPEELNFVDIINALSGMLKPDRSFEGIIPITTAKVPILKFKHKATRLEGDISLYNILALRNTELLHCYSYIDQRVVTLGYAIKVFAKVCDIGDASQGSLSSYAYMLLMLHYLQHTNPPVIPILQELKDAGERSDCSVDGWNAWFYDDIEKLHEVWPDYRKNTQTLGELWLGFFRYFVEEFDISGHVVTIRQQKPLTKFEKLWNGKVIAIEDPFILSHNLGAGVTFKMHDYIMSALTYAREHFGTVKKVPANCSLLDYVFDVDELTEGEVPKGRLCRECGKIGHSITECPVIMERKQRSRKQPTKKNR